MLRPTRYLPFVALLALFLAGCDIIESVGTITLQPTNQTVTFRFTNVQNGISREVVGDASLSLDSYLRGEGFSAADVVGARVTGASVRLSSPLGEALDLFRDIDVSLQSGTAGPVTVASLASLPDRLTADLNTSRRDVTAFVQGGAFQGLLGLVGTRNVQDDVVLNVTLTFEIDVEGF